MPALVDFLPKVYEITNRPDLVNETTNFLNRALQRSHNRGEYNFDVFTETYSYAGSQSLTGALPARFKRYYNVTADETLRVHEVNPASLYDDNVQMEKRNTFYVAGSDVIFRFTDAFQSIAFQYLRQPTFADSYIATNYENSITYFAAALVFKMMGNLQKFQFWQAEALAVDEEITRNHFIP